MVFAQCQRLGGLNETFGPVGITIEVHNLILHLPPAPRSSANGRKHLLYLPEWTVHFEIWVEWLTKKEARY